MDYIHNLPQTINLASILFLLFASEIQNSFLKNLAKPKKQSPEVFYDKVVLKIFLKFTGKHLCWSLNLIKLQAFSCSFSVKFAKFLGTPFFYRTFPVAAFEENKKYDNFFSPLL